MLQKRGGNIMRICIPVQKNEGSESKPYNHFGSAKNALFLKICTFLVQIIYFHYMIWLYAGKDLPLQNRCFPCGYLEDTLWIAR